MAVPAEVIVTTALEVRDLTVRLGRTEVVKRVSLTVAGGAVVGVVGPNGAGKTTLVDAVTGFVASSGSVSIAGRPAAHLRPHRRVALGVARTFQSLELFEDLTVGENLAVAADAAGVRARDSRPAAELVARAAATAGIDHILDLVPGQLPYGRRKQVALARALAAGPSVLLLDEPAAGLDGPARRALAATLRSLADGGVAVVLVDHDVHLVFDVCDEVAVLDSGRVVAQGRPGEVRADPVVAAAWLGAPRGPAASRPAPAATPPPPGPAAAGSRPPALELVAMSTGWRRVATVHAVDLTVAEGELVALLGANGAGKTTTLLAVSGALEVLGGSARVAGVAVGGGPDGMARRGVAHAPQDRGVLGGLTVAEQLRLAAGAGRDGRSGVADALGRLPALGPLLGRRGRLLSGGEQQQVSLGRAIASRPRLLLVDELSLGLAPDVVSHTLGVLRGMADEGVAVLLVEQFASLALTVADRAYVLHRGRVALEGLASDLAARPEALEAAYLGAPSGSP
ncbi:MAG: ATP-binding cassette domain-containing protein [Acidimicrobiales bacterium]